MYQVCVEKNFNDDRLIKYKVPFMLIKEDFKSNKIYFYQITNHSFNDKETLEVNSCRLIIVYDNNSEEWIMNNVETDLRFGFFSAMFVQYRNRFYFPSFIINNEVYNISDKLDFDIANITFYGNEETLNK